MSCTKSAANAAEQQFANQVPPDVLAFPVLCKYRTAIYSQEARKRFCVHTPVMQQPVGAHELNHGHRDTCL